MNIYLAFDQPSEKLRYILGVRWEDRVYTNPSYLWFDLNEVFDIVVIVFARFEFWRSYALT